MKILQAIASINPEGGGPVESLKQVGGVLTERGYSVEVVSLDDPKETYVENFPLKLHALGPSKTFYNYSGKFVPWLLKNHGNYDCIIVRGIWRYNSYGVWRALKESKTPYYVFTHGMLDPWFKEHYPLKHLRKYFFWLFAEYKVLRDAKAVFFTSEEEKVLARESFSPYRCNEVVVAYGTKGTVGEQKKLKESFFQANPDLVEKRLITFLGRIHEKKGCDLLLEAFGKVAQQYQDLHLVIAGPDQVGLQAKLKELSRKQGVEEQVSWPGMVIGEKKWELLSASEAFILPSHQENFGIVVAEALSSGTPVLISDKVNIWREIKESNAGFVAPDTVEGTTKLLEDWLSLSAEKKEEFSKNARACFESSFSVERAADSLIESLTSST